MSIFRDDYLLLSLLLAIALSLVCSVSAGTMRFEELPAQDQIRFTYGGLEVTFADAARGFAVNGIRHIGFSSQFGGYPTTGTITGLWRVRFSNDLGASGRFVELWNFSSATRLYSFDPNEGLTLFFTGLDLPGETDTVDVTVRIRPLLQSGMTGWTIHVANRSSTYAIWDILFPKVDFGNIDGDGPHSTIVVPRSEGRFYVNPIDGGTISSGLKEPQGQWYPGGGYQMQYSAYYRKLGDPYYPDKTRSAGIYLASYDGAPVAPKKFSYTPGTNVWTYACTNHPNDVSTIGADYIMPYDHVMGVFAGDWYDASQIYRQWALQQSWASKGPISSRTDMADWYKQVTAVHRTDGEGRTPSQSADTALELNSRITGPMIVQWYKWGLTRDNDYPPVVSAQPGFAAAVNTMVDADIYPFPYVNGRMWSSYDPGWSIAEPYAKRDPDGQIHWASGVDSYCADMEYGTEFWRNYMANVCANLVQTHGVKGIYLDEMGKATEYGDYDPSHGNPLGINESCIAFEHQGLQEIADAVHVIDPEVMLWGEGAAEFSMDVLHGKLIPYSLYRGCNTPVFSAVYHDYWTFSGKTVGDGDKAEYPGTRVKEMQIGWVFVTGAQMGRIWPGCLRDQMSMDYLASTTALRSIASKYLILGRMMRPPFIDAAQLPELSTELKKGGAVSMPAVLASAWQSPDNELGLAVTNMYREPLHVNITMNLDEYDVPTGQVAYQFYQFDDPNVVVCNSVSRVLQFSLTLGARDSKVYELRTSNCAEYERSDINKDGYVDFRDFAILMDNWLGCTDPNGANCENIQ